MIYAIRSCDADETAKLLMMGRSHGVRLPVAFRFDATEGFIRRDPLTGDVILSQRPPNWHGFFTALTDLDVPDEFLSDEERPWRVDDRDPFAGWRE